MQKDRMMSQKSQGKSLQGWNGCNMHIIDVKKIRNKQKPLDLGGQW